MSPYLLGARNPHPRVRRRRVQRRARVQIRGANEGFAGRRELNVDPVDAAALLIDHDAAGVGRLALRACGGGGGGGAEMGRIKKSKNLIESTSKIFTHTGQTKTLDKRTCELRQCADAGK